ncbi:hypothetical protein [Streptomyces sp. SM8]|uniref:hypothetical protein n=1 Tax=Streptomyces sp. SM8 TaxID=1195457 RepID=UPI001F3AFD76|nr:hypothetical protein [Streptomyces sp. SM8]
MTGSGQPTARRSWSPGDSVAAAVEGELALLTPGVRADPAEAARLLDPMYFHQGTPASDT